MSNVLRNCAVAFAIAISPPAFAHGDDGGPAAQLLDAGTTRVTFGYDLVHYNGIDDATLTALALQGVEEVHSLKTISVPSLAIAYGVTRDLTLAMRLPYLHNQEIRETDPAIGGVAARAGVDGFGDLSLTGTYRFLRQAQTGFDAMIVLGIKLPTGRTDAIDDLGEVFETEHQPGSGSWDGIFGASVEKTVGATTFSASALYGLAGPGSQDTTLGDRFGYSVGASYRLFGDHDADDKPMHVGAKFDGMMHHGGLNSAEHGHEHEDYAIDVSLSLDGAWQGKNDAAGELLLNTGGHVLYLTPGATFTAGRYSTFVNVGIPIAENLNGIQADPDWRISSGLSVDF
jgi:hypothetical protein